MKSLKIKLISVIVCAVIAVACVATCLGINVARADRDVTVSGSTVFITAADAQIWSHKDGSADDYYTMLVLTGEGDSVNFRKDLAFNWYESAPKAEGEQTLKGEQGWFNMEIGFEPNAEGKLAFEKYILTFESQSYTQNKDGKTTNYIIFAPAENGTKVKVLITDDKEEEFPETAQAIAFDKIKIAFTDNTNGDYSVTVSSGAAELTGTFKNIGGTFARFSSSTTTPVTPISFGFKPAEGNSDPAKLAVYSLNGQSFKLKNTPTQDNGHYRSGVINDDTPPVLCLSKGLSFIGHDKEISFNYTVIDVVTSSPSLETSYFMLTKADAAKTDFNADAYETEGLFTVVKDSDDQKMDPHVNHYVPATTDYNATLFDEDMKVTAAVKVLLKLTDTTSTGGQSTHVMLDWYVDDDHIVNVNDNKYIAVATDTKGAAYTHTDGTATSPKSESWKATLEEYQAAVTKAAEGIKAGSKNKFYLPAANSLFKDNATDYEDLTYSIYYISNSRQQESSKAANALSIPLNKAGKYIFTIYATDAESNEMYYYDANGERKTFGTGDIWTMYDDEKLKDYLPWFEFEVEAPDLSIEEVKEQSTAFVGSTFTPTAFEINGVSYKTTYSLYVFDSAKYYEDNGKTLTYSEFMAQKEQLINDSEHGRQWFTYIYSSSDPAMKEGTDVYEKYHDYQWNSTSPSFVPQDANTFYLIKCEVESTDNTGTLGAVAYVGVASAPKVKTLVGEDTWVQDNMTSIILLCVAGASLVGIVLLLVIKPKDKGDLDEIEMGKSKKKK